MTSASLIDSESGNLLEIVKTSGDIGRFLNWRRLGLWGPSWRIDRMYAMHENNLCGQPVLS